MSKLLWRLAPQAAGLVGFCGMASLLLSFVMLPEGVRRLEELAAMAQKVRAEVVTSRVKAERRGRSGSYFAYIGVGDFRVAGVEGDVIRDVPLQENWGLFDADPIEEAPAKALVQRFPPGRVVDAWFDPRSRTADHFFPLSLTDPVPLAVEKRRTLGQVRLAGGVLLIIGLAGIVAVIASEGRATR